MTDPIRVYVGSVHSHRLMVQVLSGSIQRHTRRDVEVRGIGDALGGEPPLPKNPKNRPATPFSFQRFAVPMLANYRGRAIYMDADQLVLGDVAELFDRPMWGLPLQCRPTGGPDGARNRNRSSVMLIDCARTRWEPQEIADGLDAERFDYHKLMSLKFVWLAGWFPRHWNSLDHYEPGRTRLLHYTKRPTQPWVSRRHPHAHLWFEALFAGLDDGSVSADTLREALDKRYCRPSVAWQVEQRIADPGRVPSDFEAEDAAFFAYCEKNQFNNLDGVYRSN